MTGRERPKSGSRGRSDSGLTVDGDRVQGSLVEIEAMLEKDIRVVHAGQPVTVKVETYLYWWRRKEWLLMHQIVLGVPIKIMR